MQPSHTPAAAPKHDLFAVLAGCLFVFLVGQRHGLLNPYIINDDVRQQLFWMRSWADPELFRDYLLGEYSRLYVSWGVRGIYRTLCAVFPDPLVGSKILTGLLYAGMGLTIHLTGRALALDVQGRRSEIWGGGPRALAWAMTCVYWLMPAYMNRISGGLARAWAFPLLALFLLGWLRRENRLLAVALLLQALFIPYIFLLCGLACGLNWAAGLLPGVRNWTARVLPSRWWHWLVLFGSATLVLFFSHGLDQAGFGPLVTKAEMLGRPEFTEAGRLRLLPVPGLFLELVYKPFEFIGNFRQWGLVAGIATLVVLTPMLLLGARRADWSGVRNHRSLFLWLAVASLLLYVAARVLLLRLFLPARYVSYSALLLYCPLLALCGLGFLRYFPGIKTNSRPVAAAVILGCLLVGSLRMTDVGLYDYSAETALYERVSETVPKDGLIAGHPSQMDNVLIFSGRKVLATFELSHPWSRGYWARMRPRLRDLFEAYYSIDPEQVLNFCRKYGITHFVVDDRHFSDGFLAGRPFFEPFDTEVREQVARVRDAGDDFALLQPGLMEETRVDEHIRILEVPAE